jgi:hypothetical protein
LALWICQRVKGWISGSDTGLDFYWPGFIYEVGVNSAMDIDSDDIAGWTTA